MCDLLTPLLNQNQNIMKKIIITIAAVCLFIKTAGAQETAEPPKEKTSSVEIGARYAPTFSFIKFRTVSGDEVEGTARLGHGFSGLIGYNFGKHIGIVGEVNYYNSSQKFADNNLEREVNVSYLNIPLLLSLNTNKSGRTNLNFVAGPQFGLNIGSSVKTSGNAEADTLEAVIGLKQGDVGLAYGAGLEFMVDESKTIRLDIGYRGFYGFVDMNTSDNGNGTYNVMVTGTRKTHGAYAGIAIAF